jgi:hypothetical protein
MTPIQIEFLRLNANQVKFEIISKTLNIDRDTLFKWYYDFEKERLAITKIRNLWLPRTHVLVLRSFLIQHLHLCCVLFFYRNAQMPKFCTECGYSFPGMEKFCPDCGNKR